MATKREKYSYDGRCFDLAEYFLTETVCTKEDREDLAQDIQDTVEGWFLAWENKNVPPSGQPRK